MKAIQISFLLLLICFINCGTSFSCNSFFELMMSQECKDVFSNSTHGCLYTGSKCELSLLGCSSYKGTDSSVCASTIPTGHSVNKFKCELVNNECKDVEKKCSEHKEGITNCEELDAEGENKRCILNNNKCESHFITCDLSGKDQQTCEANIPKDERHKCVWKGNSCKEEMKNCKEVKFYNDDCIGYAVSDSENQICLGSYDGCKEQYKTCELYNQKASNKNKKDCESIKFKEGSSYEKYKCVFNDNACSTGEKCSDFTYEEGCNDFIPSDTNKRCSFINGVCKEIYKSCELYDTKTESGNKKEADCKETKEYYSYGSIDFHYKCVFDKEKNSCEKKELTNCTDYETGMDESYCYNINLNEYKRCTINDKDNKCIERYIGCPEKITKDNCEAIDLGNDYYFCKYNEGKNGCYKEFKDCSLGKDEASCKSIVLYEEGEYGEYGPPAKKNYKCVWESNACKEKQKECGDAQNADECNKITPTSNDKYCIYMNGQCKEQYKNCETYKGNEQSVCESIVPDDISSKCVFKSEATNKCVKEPKYSSCSDFKKDDYEYLCTYISIAFTDLSVENKCSYSNSACSEVKKTCLELSNESDANEEICGSAPTSGNNKYCSLKADESGCEEKEKENANNKGTFGLCYKKLWFNLLVILFGLLL